MKERLVVFDWLNRICSLRPFGIAGGVCSGAPVFSHCVMGVDTPPGSSGDRMTIDSSITRIIGSGLVSFYFPSGPPYSTSNLSRDRMSYTGWGR